MMKEICDICGKDRVEDFDESIEGKIRVSKMNKSKDLCTVFMTVETKDIYLCPSCTKKMFRYIDEMKGKKRTWFGSKKEH